MHIGHYSVVLFDLSLWDVPMLEEVGAILVEMDYFGVGFVHLCLLDMLPHAPEYSHQHRLLPLLNGLPRLLN